MKWKKTCDGWAATKSMWERVNELLEMLLPCSSTTGSSWN